VSYLPPVSTTPVVPVAKFSAGVIDTSGKLDTGVVETGEKFATGVINAGGKFAAGPWIVKISWIFENI
jgi:hypothetical protein